MLGLAHKVAFESWRFLLLYSLGGRAVAVAVVVQWTLEAPLSMIRHAGVQQRPCAFVVNVHRSASNQ